MPEIKFKHFDEYRSAGILKGIFLGGCVERGDGSSFRRRAHAHNYKGTAQQGWICVRSRKRVMTKTGKPSELMLHELAHLLAPNQPHNKTFDNRLKELKNKYWKASQNSSCHSLTQKV